MTITWKTETRRVTELKPYEFNPRTITKDDLEKLKQSLINSGYHAPILIDLDNTIIAGHARWHALKQLKVKTLECRVPDRKLTESEFKEINIRDNVNNGNWDVDVLANNFDVPSLIEWGVPENLFAGFEADSMSGTTGLTDDDSVPEVPVEPTSKLGDLYALGDHKLLCGDSTNLDHVKRLMGEDKADMVFTDPPYGVSYADKNKSLNAVSKGNRIQTPIINDSLKDKELAEFFVMAFTSLFESMKEGAGFYVSAPQGGEQMMMMMMMSQAGLPVRHELIWVKNNHVLGRADYHYKHEPVLYGWKEGAAHSWYGERNQFSTLMVDKPHSSKLHPTMKPIELIEIFLKNSSKGDDIILDLFGGSGSTLIACEKTNRKCYMMELSPNYCDVIIKRWEEFTGKKAELIK